MALQRPGNSWNAIEAITASSAVTANLRSFTFSDTQEMYVLQPGEIALCWVITSETYVGGLATKDEQGNPVYNYDMFRAMVLDDQGRTIPTSVKIIPLDYTIGSGRFNLANSYCFRLYLTRRTGNIDSAVATADLSDLTSVPNTSVIYGPASGGGPILEVWNRTSPSDYSVLSSVQTNLW